MSKTGIIKKQKAFPSGHSLIEMMVVLVILAIVMSVVISLIVNTNKAVERQQTNILLDKEVEVFFRRFENQLSTSFGWIRGTPHGLSLIAQNGDSVLVNWDAKDSMLFVDNAAQFPAGVKVDQFSCFYMPKKAEEIKIEREFWLREVDQDENGVIEGTELHNVSMLFVELKVVKRKSSSGNSKYCHLPPAIVETVIDQQNE
ncbi:MAG: type II secretion system protein [Desulfocucumaceae bacterium]